MGSRGPPISSIMEVESEKIVSIIFTDKTVSDVDPFLLEEELNAAVNGEVSISYRRGSSNEVRARVLGEQVSRLLSLNKLCGASVAVSRVESRPLVSRGLIRCPLLDSLEVSVIADRLKPQGVSAVKKLMSALNPNRAPGYVLTFENAVPEKIKVCGMVLRVNEYVLPPIRCYGCQRFGHVKAHCQRQPVCPRCAKVIENDKHETECKNSAPRCVSCRGPHDSRSVNCPQYKKEAKAKRFATSQNIPVAEAKVVLSQSQRRSGDSRLKEGVTYAGMTSGPSQASSLSPVNQDVSQNPVSDVTILMNTVSSLSETVAALTKTVSSLSETVNTLMAKVDSLAAAVTASGRSSPTTKKRKEAKLMKKEIGGRVTSVQNQPTEKVFEKGFDSGDDDLSCYDGV